MTSTADANNNQPPARRSPETVMRLARMGASHQGRLSFMRTLLRRIKKEQWQYSRPLFEIDEQGYGRAVYTLTTANNSYSLVAFSHHLPDSERSDRVIAEAWDSTFTLFDGIPTEDDLQRLADNVPKQEAGRISDKEICLSRANRSVRLFESVVESLSNGQQPSRELIESVGYLMRTTAVYGSGKFGAKDRLDIQRRPELSGPFQAEMLTVWLIRTFTLDVVQYVADLRGGDKSVLLDPELRRCFGVGNSTGLGMAPFLINHPTLINHWIMAREEAIARVLAVETAQQSEVDRFMMFVRRAELNARHWHSDHPLQLSKIASLNADFKQLMACLDCYDFTRSYPWKALFSWAKESLSFEGQEQLSMLLLEPYPDLVDPLTDCMSSDELHLPMIKGQQSAGQLCQILEAHYRWALDIDFSAESARDRFWYVSEEKLEPRLGQRFEEPGMELEQPLCVGWHVYLLYAELRRHSADLTVAEFLMQQPKYRHIVRRVQCVVDFPYMEVQDNLIDESMLPIDLLRLKLSFFGATKFDPRSDRWLRITMFQHAPFPDELDVMSANDWVYPPLPEKEVMS